MNHDSKHTRAFWLIFVPVFILTSFIPVLPLYMGAAEPVFIMMLPVWAIYASIFVMPQWILFSCPVVITHSGLTYLMSLRLAQTKQKPIRFSLTSLLSVTFIIASGITLVLAFRDVGFCLMFFACMLAIIIANCTGRKTVSGMPVPKMNKPFLIASSAILGTMLLFGIPILIGKLAG